MICPCNLSIWNVGVAMYLSKKKRNNYQCTTQHIITTKLLSWENCRKVYLQGKDPVESFCLSVRVVLCCTLLVQDISVRMHDVNTRFNHITLCVLFLNYWDRIHFSYGLRYLLLFDLLLISLAHCINKCRIEYAFDGRCRWVRKKILSMP